MKVRGQVENSRFINLTPCVSHRSGFFIFIKMKTLLLIIYLLTTDYSDWVAIKEPPSRIECCEIKYRKTSLSSKGIIISYTEYWYIIRNGYEQNIGIRFNNSKVILWDKDYLK